MVLVKILKNFSLVLGKIARKICVATFFTEKKPFFTIKISILVGGKICIFRTGLVHSSDQNVDIFFTPYF